MISKYLTKMPKKILVTLLLIIPIISIAQKLKKNEFNYKSIQLPEEYLGDDLEHYSFTVETPYGENNDEIIAKSLADFEIEVAESEATYKEELYEAQQTFDEETASYDQRVLDSEVEFEADQANYDSEVLLAQENFKIESEEYNKLSKLERLALGESGKPKLKMPRKPVYRKPTIPKLREPYHRKPVYREPDLSRIIVFDRAQLAKNYFRLDGYEEGTENALVGKITVQEFEFLDTETKYKEVTKTNSKTKERYTVKEPYYVTYIKHPTQLELVYNGEVIYSDVVPGANEFTMISDKKRPNMVNLEKQNLDEVLKKVNEFINKKHGFSEQNSKIELKSPKNKGDYDDTDEAMNMIDRGLKSLNKYSEPLNTDLEAAITQWKDIISKAEYDNKKARINAKVAVELYFNAIEVSLIGYQIQTAEELLNEMTELDLSSGDRKNLDNLRKKLENLRKALEGLRG